MTLKSSVTIPPRTIAVLDVQTTNMDLYTTTFCEVKPSAYLLNEFPNLQMVPTIHKVNEHEQRKIPFVVINHDVDAAYIDKRQVMGYILNQQIDVSEIKTTMNYQDQVETEEDESIKDKKFITSPADIEVHRKPN